MGSLMRLSLQAVVSVSVALCFFSCCVNGANILAIFPSVWKSHDIFGRSLIKHLISTNPNHKVTIISPYSNVDNDDKQIDEIKINGLFQNWMDMGMSFDIESMRIKSNMERFTSMLYAGSTNIDILLNDKQIHQFLKNNKQIDLIIVDLFLSEALLGFSAYYNAPTVVISPTGSTSWLNHITGNPQSFALDPSSFLPFTENMNLWQRCINTLMGTFEKLSYNLFLMISQEAIYEKHFGYLNENSNITLPNHRDVARNLSLVLVNSNAVVQYPKANLPNILQLAGMHLLDAESLTLPPHLLSFIKSPREGTIYISFGANVQMTNLSKDRLNIFLDIFDAFPETNFLFKLDKIVAESTNFPSNVFVADWFPQQAILAQAEVMLFISSCGLMSVIEAMKSATPILAIPIETEQKVTCMRLETHGAASVLEFESITYETVYHMIKTMTKQTNFKEKMQDLSNILLYDTPQPIVKALHYIDMILETRGAAFLKTNANNFTFLHTAFAVGSIIIVGIVFIVAIPFAITCCILRKSYNQNVEKFINSSRPIPNSNNKVVKQFGRSHSYTCFEESSTTNVLYNDPPTCENKID